MDSLIEIYQEGEREREFSQIKEEAITTSQSDIDTDLIFCRSQVIESQFCFWDI